MQTPARRLVQCLLRSSQHRQLQGCLGLCSYAPSTPSAHLTGDQQASAGQPEAGASSSNTAWTPYRWTQTHISDQHHHTWTRLGLPAAVPMHQTACMEQPWRGLRAFSSNDSSPPSSNSPPSASSAGADAAQGAPGELRMSLQEALMRLVDAAVEMVEQGRTDEAVAVLKEGIATFEPKFPDSPELGELHNQVALLSLVEGDTDAAVSHATTALGMTRKHFSHSGSIVGHRQLRLGVSLFAQGRITDAAEHLHGALEALQGGKDPSQYEAAYYLSLCLLAGTRAVGQVAQTEGRLLADLKEMVKCFGAESMIVSLALAQHDRIAHQPLAAAEPEPLLCEALLKQHTKLLEAVNPNSEDLAVAHYKLATFYYVHDMLTDARGYVQMAGSALRATHPDDHDLVALCKHRLGMVCAVMGDHQAATRLLNESLARYGGADTKPGAAMTGLAREAKLGLAIAKYHALGPVAPKDKKQEVFGTVRAALDELAAAVGVNHMLSRGGMRHVAQISATLK